MRLMTPQAWAEKYFAEGSHPPETTVRRWMQSGVIPARKIGGSWFVDEHAWLIGGGKLDGENDLARRFLDAG